MNNGFPPRPVRMHFLIGIALILNITGNLCAQKTVGEKRILYHSTGKPAPGAMYPRLIRLEHSKAGTVVLLATFEEYIDQDLEPSFPIYRSLDQGRTWSLYSRVTDTKNHFGMRYQPQLFELPQAVGDLPAGTVLCAGSSIPKDFSSTELLLFVSPDGGKTWRYRSPIVKGGGVGPTIPLNQTSTGNGDAAALQNDPVWEPFLALDKQGRLVCHYSDERSKKMGFDQLLAHKISGDGGKTWGDAVNDVAVADTRTRPGMAVTAKLVDGRYIMVYEVVGIEHNPVYCRYSDDGDNWGDPAELGTRIVDSSNGYFMSGTPYIIRIPGRGPNGTLIVTAKGVIQGGEMKGEGFMVNNAGGSGSWHFEESIIRYDPKKHSGGYSRSTIGIGMGRILMLTPVPVEGERSDIYCSVEEIK